MCSPNSIYLSTPKKASRWLSWYGVGLASADKLPVVVRIPAGPLGSLKCNPPKGNGRRPQKKTFPTPKLGIKQIEQFSDIILRILQFLAESSGVTKLELFQPFSHVHKVLAGVPTPSDSGKTPQLKILKLAQNC